MGELHYLCIDCVRDYARRKGVFEDIAKHASVKKLAPARPAVFTESCCACGRVRPVDGIFHLSNDEEYWCKDHK